MALLRSRFDCHLIFGVEGRRHVTERRYQTQFQFKIIISKLYTLI